MAKLNLSPPWVVYYKKLSAFFKEDPEVKITYDDIEQEIKIYVDNSEKAAALTKLLPREKEFGNIKLIITIIPANMIKASNTSDVTNEDVFFAFDRNEAVNDIKVISGIMTNSLIYVIFAKKVVSYFTDDLGDYNGICSTLYQNLAKEIFIEVPNVFYCTDIISMVKTGWL